MKILIVTFCLFLYFGSNYAHSIPFSSDEEGASRQGTCGYSSCNPTKNGMLNVHLIPHSHDDVGWLKTVDQYFVGSSRQGWEWENQKVGVTDVLDSITRSLSQDPNRRYIQVETAFFWRWWEEQPENIRTIFRDLVNSGQLEFIGGGWSMNDEGAAHYVAIIDNMSLGFKILNQTFGECGRPRVSWQVDPFGHSREQANLFKQMGFDGYFFGRLDERDKMNRMANKSMEMIWQTSDDYESEIFTGINYNVYWPPPGFCYDYYCDDEPIMDNPSSKEYNVDNRVQEFIDYVENQTQSYDTDNILVCFGMDFHYQASHTWYKNIDKLIKYVNDLQGDGSTVNLLYSTPSCYLDALSKANSEWPVKTGDFFPYASDEHAYWTGYFTSRPTSKRMIHEATTILQVAKQVSAAVHNSAPDDSMTSSILDATFELEKAIGVTQHHDAITGTERQHVADDYSERLAAGTSGFANVTFGEMGFQACPLLNISQCEVSESHDVFVVRVYNPSAQVQTRYIHIPVPFDKANVTLHPQGDNVQAQLIPLPQPVLDIPGRNSIATHNLIFKATDLPALGSKYYRVIKDLTPGRGSSSSVKVEIPDTGMAIEIGSLNMRFDAKSNHQVAQVTKNGKQLTLTQEFKYYLGFEGDNYPAEERASGAYVFRPQEEEPNTYPEGLTSEIFDGDLVTETQEVINDYISQVKRVYKGDPGFDFELEWLVGPIPIEDDSGKEIISTIKVDEIDNEGIYFTDANGRQMMRRERNMRDSFQIPVTEPVSQNYYPVNSRISIVDQNGDGRLTVLNDRSQAGGSIRDGEVELLLHRRLLFDDDFGVGEPLNEIAFGVGLVARGRHYILLDEDEAEAQSRHRLLGNQLFLSPYVLFYPGEIDSSVMDAANALDVALNNPLAPNLNLLTLEPWYTNGEVAGSNRFFLVRIEHFFQRDEHATLSQDATADLTQLFSSLGTVVDMKETTLGANLFKEDQTLDHQLWKKKTDSYVDKIINKFWALKGFNLMPKQSDFTVTLSPMQIRTFVVEIE